MTINSIDDYAKYLGIEVADLKKAIYKGTSCGAWIDWSDASGKEGYIVIGSIVEGSDAEFYRYFDFPTDSVALEEWLEELEELCDEAWREAHYDAEYYRVLNGTDEIVTYEELCMRMIQQGADEWFVNQEIDDAIDEGAFETVPTSEAKPIWEEQQRRMKRCTDCACLESGDNGEWICGVDGKCVIHIEHCESVEKPSLLSTVYTEEDLKEMGL